ncbi:MAG TPA: nucleoside triphosphate pyrophosphohydrolase family protein [Candidatus Doudnabacteria bacterium]|nr:nucleoside triphosphate pyrophosphohydrolase family protein [Candidatus Doudnabacteria bacterium]
MTFNEYQEASQKTAVYDPGINALYYLGLGVTGEAGEIAEKLKKILRNNDGRLTDEMKQELKKEIGDVLWYLSQLSGELGFTFSEVAQANVDKLRDRKDRGVIKSQGDNR